jgi:DNA-binding transcriptional ArsR family regulator
MTSTQTTISDPSVMRALAHPVRLSLLEHLSRSADGATATECAAVVGLSPSATSYHLRALAKVGMIREAPSRGDARERVWQSTHRTFAVEAAPGASASDLAAEAALTEMLLARQNDKVRRFLAAPRSEQRDWWDASLIAEQGLTMTSKELRTLTRQIQELVEPFLTRNRLTPPRGARPVSFQLRVVPVDPD